VSPKKHKEPETNKDTDKQKAWGKEDNGQAKAKATVPHEKEKEKERNHTENTKAPEPRVSNEASRSVNIAQEASEEMKLASGKLDVGRFQDALPHVDKSLLLLTTDVNTYRPQIKVCAQYKIALHILIQISEIDNASKLGTEGKEALVARQSAAHLARQLAALRLSGKHNVICIRMAITKNIEAENYGIAADLLRFLLTKNPPDSASLNAKLIMCTQNGEQNSPTYVHCAVYCCQQFVPILDADYLVCNACASSFTESVGKAGAGCWVCKVGVLAENS